MMNKTILATIGTTVLIAAILAFTTVQNAASDDDNGKKGLLQSDHGIVSFATGDTAGYCGSSKEPWILDISASGGSLGGSLTITFNDGDAVTYPIAADSSFSAQFNFGGVPGTDNVVEITGSGIPFAVISALATNNAKDPFSGTGEVPAQKDNFCIVVPGEGSPTNFGSGASIITLV